MTQQHRESIYHHFLEDHDENVVINLAERIIAARNRFFADVSNLEMAGYATDDYVEEGGHPSLWFLVDVWLDEVKKGLRVYLGPDTFEEQWDRFRHLVPPIYLAIMDQYLSDPSKLDRVVLNVNTGVVETRQRRRVTAALPRTIPPGYPADVPEEDRQPITSADVELGRVISFITGRGTDSENWPAMNYRPFISNGN